MANVEGDRLELAWRTLPKGKQNFAQARDMLRYFRENKERRPEVTRTAGKFLLQYESRLGDEFWAVLEQLFYASADTLFKKSMESIYGKLRLRFPDSRRVRGIKGLFFEFNVEAEKANEVYQSILKEDPANAFAMKRQIASLKSRGEKQGAIEALNCYLEIYQTDSDAWEELAELYLSLFMYKNALFCYEEMLLKDPHVYITHLKIADTLYSMGGNENLRSARKYYAHALTMNPDNTRALYGIILCTKAATKDPGAQRLFEMASKKLQAKYQSEFSGDGDGFGLCTKGL